MANRNFLQAFPDQDLIQPSLQEGSLLPPQTFGDSAAVSRRLWKTFQDGSESVVYKQLEALFAFFPLEPRSEGEAACAFEFSIKNAVTPLSFQPSRSCRW